MFHNLSGRLRLIINLVSGEIILCLEKCNLKKYSMSGRKQLQLSGRKDYQHSVWKCVSGALCLEENHSRGKCLEKCVWKSAPPPFFPSMGSSNTQHPFCSPLIPHKTRVACSAQFVPLSQSLT